MNASEKERHECHVLAPIEVAGGRLDALSGPVDQKMRSARLALGPAANKGGMTRVRRCTQAMAREWSAPVALSVERHRRSSHH